MAIEKRIFVFNNKAVGYLAEDLGTATAVFDILDTDSVPAVDGDIATLIFRGQPGEYEIMNLIAVNGAVVTVERGAEGTTPVAWRKGQKFVNGLTAAYFDKFYQGTKAVRRIAHAQWEYFKPNDNDDVSQPLFDNEFPLGTLVGDLVLINIVHYTTQLTNRDQFTKNGFQWLTQDYRGTERSQQFSGGGTGMYLEQLWKFYEAGDDMPVYSWSTDDVLTPQAIVVRMQVDIYRNVNRKQPFRIPAVPRYDAYADSQARTIVDFDFRYWVIDSEAQSQYSMLVYYDHFSGNYTSNTPVSEYDITLKGGKIVGGLPDKITFMPGEPNFDPGRYREFVITHQRPLDARNLFPWTDFADDGMEYHAVGVGAFAEWPAAQYANLSLMLTETATTGEHYLEWPVTLQAGVTYTWVHRVGTQLRRFGASVVPPGGGAKYGAIFAGASFPDTEYDTQRPAFMENIGAGFQDICEGHFDGGFDSISFVGNFRHSIACKFTPSVSGVHRFRINSAVVHPTDDTQTLLSYNPNNNGIGGDYSGVRSTFIGHMWLGATDGMPAFNRTYGVRGNTPGNYLRPHLPILELSRVYGGSTEASRPGWQLTQIALEIMQRDDTEPTVLTSPPAAPGIYSREDRLGDDLGNVNAGPDYSNRPLYGVEGFNGGIQRYADSLIFPPGHITEALGVYYCEITLGALLTGQGTPHQNSFYLGPLVAPYDGGSTYNNYSGISYSSPGYIDGNVGFCCYEMAGQYRGLVNRMSQASITPALQTFEEDDVIGILVDLRTIAQGGLANKGAVKFFVNGVLVQAGGVTFTELFGPDQGYKVGFQNGASRQGGEDSAYNYQFNFKGPFAHPPAGTWQAYDYAHEEE